MYSEPQMVFCESDNGSLEGYKVASDAVQIENWFTKRGHEAPVYKEPLTIGFLNSLQVNEDNRSNGEGTYLIECFLSECGECDYIFLECDTAESNAFDLQKWYETWGFKVLIEDEYPIMVRSQKK